MKQYTKIFLLGLVAVIVLIWFYSDVEAQAWRDLAGVELGVEIALNQNDELLDSLSTYYGEDSIAYTGGERREFKFTAWSVGYAMGRDSYCRWLLIVTLGLCLCYHLHKLYMLSFILRNSGWLDGKILKVYIRDLILILLLIFSLLNILGV